MRLLALLLALLALVAPAPAQDYAPSEPPEEVDTEPPAPPLPEPQVDERGQFEPWAPAVVVDLAWAHLQTVAVKDQPYIRYFDLSQASAQHLPKLQAALKFWVNSLSRAPYISIPQEVPGTGGRMYWVDIRWYRWTPEAWEKVAELDPYFREPVIPSHGSIAKLRVVAGNAVVRADWFIYVSSDTTSLLDIAEARDDDSPYYTLLYASDKIERNGKLVPVGAPKNSAEFAKLWEVDFDVLKRHPVERGGVVDTHKSSVSFSNRFLWRVRSVIGAYYQTFDVLRPIREQDFGEALIPTKYDASELIFQDQKGLQYYLLTNGNGERVEFGDPRVVRDGQGDHRGVVVTAMSCVICHAEGIRPFKDDVKLSLSKGLNLKFKNKEEEERFRVLYLQNFEQLIARDQENYAEAIQKCNGMTPAENARNFKDVIDTYLAPLDLAQAAFECGTTPTELKAALTISAKRRLGEMVAAEPNPIPRINWEQELFTEAYLVLLEWRKAVILNSDPPEHPTHDDSQDPSPAHPGPSRRWLGRAGSGFRQ